jgi:hypothetical protein
MHPDGQCLFLMTQAGSESVGTFSKSFTGISFLVDLLGFGSR